jgi:carbamoyltransferase
VDYSARVQTVRREDHPDFYDLIEAFRRITGCAVLVNTSFNVRGEPIVCTPQDAYRCFSKTEMDVLALGNFILAKSEQPASALSRSEGLEDEDPADPAENHPEAFLKSINKVFDKSFWPAAEKLRVQKKTLINRSAECALSTWVDAGEPNERARLFEFPHALLQDKPLPGAFVQDLTQRWFGSAAATELAPVLYRLIKEALKYPAKAELGIELSDSVYVMY